MSRATKADQARVVNVAYRLLEQHMELAEAAVRSKWNDAFYPALIEAAILHEDSGWIDALLPHRRLAGKTFNLPQ